MSQTQIVPLGPEDYAQLYAMATDPDPGVRAQATALARKLTPEERQTYFTFQQQQHPAGEKNRPDNTVLGMPPELSVTAPFGVARAVAGAAGMLPKAAAGARAAVDQAAPAVKYEVTRTALEKMGLPASLAIPAAIAVSGYRRGRATAKPSDAPDAAPPGTTPAPPTPPAGPASPGAAATLTAGPSSWSPQRLRNEVGLAARRQNAKLSEPEYAIAEDMVKQGVSPADAVATVAKQLAQPATTGRLRLNVAEGQEYTRLRGLGKSHEEAAQAVMQQRALTRRLGLPTSQQVQRSVTERNATGRWPEGSK